MKETFSDETLKDVFSKLETLESEIQNPQSEIRSPVHVVYGGAHLFKAATPQKLGAIALESLNVFAPDFAEFARAIWLRGADTLPHFAEFTEKLEKELEENPGKINAENHREF